MSDEEVIQKLRGGYDAFNRGDFDTVIALFHPDVEYIPVGGQPPIRGRDALRAWMQPSAFERQVIEAREITVNGDRALIRIHAAIRGAGSGIEMEVESWVVMTWDPGGPITRMEVFFVYEEDRARAAAGLGIRESG